MNADMIKIAKVQVDESLTAYPHNGTSEHLRRIYGSCEENVKSY